MNEAQILARCEHPNPLTGRITSVEEMDDRYIIETTAPGFMSLEKALSTKPVPGQTIAIYLYNGHIVQGVDIDNKPVFFKTDQEMHEENLSIVRKLEGDLKKKRKAFFRQKKNPDSDISRRLGKLPVPFRRRFEKLLRTKSEFWEDAFYELDACELAVAIAQACKTPKQAADFEQLSFKHKQELVPSYDGSISWNQLQFASYAASCYLERPNMVATLPAVML